MAQLVDAVHILCGDRIPVNDIDRAENLMISFADNFEHLYGEINTVFNIHVVRHLGNGVRFVGPLWAYSNYPFEDQIGSLVSLHKGTTDVATQISEKYLLGQNLIQSIEHSKLAKQFYEEIHSKHKFPVSHKVDGSLMIGKVKRISLLTEDERSLVVKSLNVANDAQIDEYDSVLHNSKVFYETVNCKSKRTCDSFVLNTDNGKFCEIKSIVVVHEKLYFLVNEKYDKIIDPDNKSQFTKYLSFIARTNQNVIESKFIGPKYALIKFNNTITCSKFPNMYERN